MHNDIIFKLKPHKTQISQLFVPLIIGLIILIIGLFSLLSDDSKVFFLSLSVFVIFIYMFIIKLDKIESYEIYEDVIKIKNGGREINKVLINDIKYVKIKFLSTDSKYAQSFKIKSFVFCDGRNEINNVMKHPGEFDYYLNHPKVCVRIYYNEKLENFLKSKNIEIIY
ncbi:MAG: hypothetical protein IJ948_02345 [Clostridia bacterium]|nr:hypothetical protein [Clostridia bacterium]